MSLKLNKPLFLCGMMGSGKTTVGKLLAEKLSLRFVDLDDEIENAEERSINEIFKSDGEIYFRNIERRTLNNSTRSFHGVMALGGGTLQNQEIVDYLKSKGWLIFLDAPLSVLSMRLSKDQKRPLLNKTDGTNPEKKLRKLLAERRALYSQAHVVVNTEHQTPQETVNSVLEILKKHEQ